MKNAHLPLTIPTSKLSVTDPEGLDLQLDLAENVRSQKPLYNSIDTLTQNIHGDN